jgi:site-specific recombinase XerD
MTGPASPGSKSPKLLDRVRATMRMNRYSPRTELAYVDWIKRFIRFHGVHHPQEMGADEVKAFLSHLATQMNVAASTQNQAFSARLFLYQEVLKERLPWIDDIVRAKRPAKLPVVFTQAEARAVLSKMHGTPRLMAHLLYGSGLRVMECVRLRVKDQFHRLATAPMRRSHSSKLPRKPSSQAVLKLNRAFISPRFPLFVSFTFR